MPLLSWAPGAASSDGEVARRDTLYVGELRPWPVLIPPGVAHGIPFVDARLNSWETPFL